MHTVCKIIPPLFLISLLLPVSACCQSKKNSPDPAVAWLPLHMDKLAENTNATVIAWRHDIHQQPELGNREFNTAEKIAAHLRSLGMEVTTGVAKTGVIGLLKGGRPGAVVAMRADMDALPVTEAGDLPFKSLATAAYNGATTGVMVSHWIAVMSW